MEKKVNVEEKLCKGCGLCVLACPRKIMKLSDRINLEGYKIAECFDQSKCILCKACAIMCPDSVISL